MSRTIRAQGETLQDALRTALEELVGAEVSLHVEGSEVEDWHGHVRLDLEAGSDASTDEDSEPDDDGASAEHDDRRGNAGAVDPISPEDLDEEADAAADFLEGLLDAMDLPGDLRMKVHDDHVEVEVIEIGSGALIGRRGQTLDAIQELVRCSLQRQFQRRSRVKVDAEGYRSRRLERLLEKADEAIDAALDTGEPQRLEPMDVFERKAVHHLVAEVDGLSSRSQGREPSRRVVIEVD
jgi:spoIIIJ-associated protein